MQDQVPNKATQLWLILLWTYLAKILARGTSFFFLGLHLHDVCVCVYLCPLLKFSILLKTATKHKASILLATSFNIDAKMLLAKTGINQNQVIIKIPT